MIALEAKSPDLFRGVSQEKIREWCPDESAQCTALPPDVDTQRVFGVSPLLLSCWCCMVGFAPQTQQEAALAVADVDLWEPYLEYEKTAGEISDGVCLPFLPHDLVSKLAVPGCPADPAGAVVPCKHNSVRRRAAHALVVKARPAV